MDQQLYISRFEVQNYRSCLKTVFEPTSDLSALIGINGSGKSNLLNAILLLKKATLRRGYISRRNTVVSGLCKIKISFVLNNKTVFNQLEIVYSTNDENKDEVISVEEKWNFKEFTGKNEWIEFPEILHEALFHDIAINPLNEKDAYYYYGRRSLKGYPKLQQKHYRKSLSIVFPHVRDIKKFAEGMNYYSASQFTDPSKCPSFFEVDENGTLKRPFSRNAHIQFIYDLYLAHKNDSAAFGEFLSISGDRGMNLIKTLKFKQVASPTNELEVRTGGKIQKKKSKGFVIIPNFLIKNTKLSPNQLSEGTFKTLALLYYIISDESNILLIEEPEVCIHHGLLASLIELIKAYSSRKQIFISTHSDFILDQLKPYQVFIVQNNNEGTKVNTISKALGRDNFGALKRYLNTAGNLGEYWRHGGMSL